MLPNRNSSSQQGSRPRPVNQAQDVGEQGSRDRNLGHLERDMPTVPDHLDADLRSASRASWSTTSAQSGL